MQDKSIDMQNLAGMFCFLTKKRNFVKERLKKKTKKQQKLVGSLFQLRNSN